MSGLLLGFIIIIIQIQIEFVDIVLLVTISSSTFLIDKF